MAVEVVAVERVGIDVLVGVGVASGDGVHALEAAGGRVVEPDAHQDLAGGGFRRALLGAEPSVTRGAGGADRVAVFVRGVHGRRLVLVGRVGGGDVAVQIGELEDNVADPGGGGAQVAADARHVAAGLAGVVGDVGGVVAVPGVVVPALFRLPPAAGGLGLAGECGESADRVEAPGGALVTLGLLVDQIVRVVAGARPALAGVRPKAS